MSLLNIYKSIAALLFLTILFTVEASANVLSLSGTTEQVEQLAELREYAEAGDPNAQFNLGYLNDTGRNGGIILSKDTRKAAEWYEKAALQGHAKAQSALGQLYINGFGVSKNYVIGVDWLQKAAD
ncbi:MAG: sel1 repeat family protein [Pseudomonadota bacterium]|nr:sel1 repeat family protein [Pseudomonadota bacterium]